MIKAKAGPLRILGLTEENLRRLRAGEPIAFDNSWEGAEGRTVIMYGRDEQAITDQLAEVADFPIVPETDTQ